MLAEIKDIYKPLKKENVLYNIDTSKLDYLTDICNVIDDIIESKKRKIGSPINLDNKCAEELRQEIITDKSWQNEFLNIVNLAPGIKSYDLKIPWFNSPVIFRDSDNYDGWLHFNGNILHSYITQLMRFDNKGYDSTSVSSIVETFDDKIVLGLRGGHAYADTIMTVPAGSVEYSNAPLFDTIFKEFKEELGIIPEEVALIGRIYDHAQSKNSLYVFKTKSKFTFDQINKKWETSVDKKEHKELIAVDKDFKDSRMLPACKAILELYREVYFS